MATKHIVKCPFCSQQFDANTEEYVKIKTRYAHKKCAEEHEATMTQDERDLAALFEYVKNLFGSDYNYMKVKRQIEKMKSDNPDYSYSGMKRSLQWFYEITHHPIENANGGIGIIPYIYDDARKYFYSLYVAQLANEHIDITTEAKEFVIESPRAYSRPPRLFMIDDDEEDEVDGE